jgi:hypothetical protein
VLKIQSGQACPGDDYVDSLEHFFLYTQAVKAAVEFLNLQNPKHEQSQKHADF